ncbi:hypothetical protein [Demequina muriae]|uniref:Yip1 domain-containing protein n=1 Tax=Demequina muriae TaxID=3051664 RepID=A0ABT8GJ70_9MICO|nr:hypothetical protein [Demequina sp. EGI L300058]MDN4481469.1 hypothetical protein [Demequina sp. EGI L300058]
MSDDATDTRPYGGNTRAAWLATATGIPLYVLMWAIVWGPGVQLFGSLADIEPRPTVENSTLAAIAAINILTVLVGLAVVAHTVGRVVFARTSSMAVGQAAVVFAAMAAVLAVVPVVLVGVGQEDTGPAVAAAIVIILVPCVVSAGATRALLPAVDRYAALRGTVMVLLVIAIIAVVVFTFYAYAGAGQ